MTTLPAFSKLTVIRVPIIDCTCPSPQSGRPGSRTSVPGSRNGFRSRSGSMLVLPAGGGRA
jgi:hypothetical protein